MENNFLFDRMFKALKTYVDDNSEFKIYIFKKPVADKFPVLIVRELSNTSADNMNVISNVTYELNIYTKDFEYEGVLVDSLDVADYIRKLIREFMEKHTNLKRTFNQPTPNIDDSIFRIAMRYSGKINDFRCHYF